jgi:hypothetical protein
MSDERRGVSGEKAVWFTFHARAAIYRFALAVYSSCFGKRNVAIGALVYVSRPLISAFEFVSDQM